MAISVAGGDFFIWKKPRSYTRWIVSTQIPNPDGTPRKRGTDTVSVNETAARIICGGVPPEGKRVYKLRSRLMVAGELGGS